MQSFFNKQPVYKQQALKSKNVKQFLELGRDNSRNQHLILKAKICDSTVVPLHFTYFSESFLNPNIS